MDGLGTALGVAFATVFTVYTLGSVGSFFRPVAEWMQRHTVFGRTIRTFFPGWGFFAQDFGMFDIHLLWRTVARSEEDTDWLELSGSRVSIGALLWRPGLRKVHNGTVLGLRIMQFDGIRRPELILGTAEYRRALARIRRECRRVAPDAAADPDTRVQFLVRIARGWWSAEPPRTVFTSPPEPVEAGENR